MYTAAQVRALDRCAIEQFSIPAMLLMARAAAASLEYLLSLWPDTDCVQVFCGGGNNGGDGYLLADLAHKRGLAVQVYELAAPARLSVEAALARQQAQTNGVALQPYSGVDLIDGVIVDAMLGIGLNGEVRAPWVSAIEAINTSGLPVLSLDIPSGVCSDSGRILGAAVRADATITFIGLKRGLFTLDAPDCAGAILLTDLELPQQVYQQCEEDGIRLELESLLASLPPRPATTHKGHCGALLIIGGDYGMAGAVAMAAEAAMRCGAGLVRVATRAEHVAAVVARTPEVMVHGVRNGQDIEALIDQSELLVVGPGLGQSPWSEQLLRVAAASGKPMVLDADGLNLLARGELIDNRRRSNWVLTPHPGEAASLLQITTAEVQRDRFAAARALQQRYGGVTILKGNGSLVVDQQQLLLSDYGNPGMACGGMGDVLSGVIGALWGQKMPALDAAALGVCLHGAAADLGALEGQRGLLASDLPSLMRGLLG